MNRCYFCGGELVEELTTFIHEDDGNLWMIRGVPAFVCTQCGEKEYTEDTTRRVLTLLEAPPRPAEILHVPAYDLAAS